MIISSLVAMNSNNLIGVNNDLPWKLKDDLEHFKNYSMGKPIIMGRNTFDSIGRPLPNRINIIVSSQIKQVEGCHICKSLDEAIELGKTHTNDEIILIGGSRIFQEGMQKINKLVISWVDADHLKGDVYFPEFDISDWLEVSNEHYRQSDRNEFSFEIKEYIKK
ncbi:dihydrofolate reductase [Gammaproteobacteria bacterium]|nr:dihydrofolate reductase [Gammaproteobacteria bacterium]|tara:strand:- start:30120 stop:30611 length:492 start_codon:yes stop_codon:yes gene_type:complete